jgi:hypothetical protein
MTPEIKKRVLAKFNPVRWDGHVAFRHYTHSGMNLIDEVNALDPDLVIDVGCGHNRFKGHIKNLIGFDPQPFPMADIQSDIQSINFREESADVLLVLGSIQFGTKEDVANDFNKVVKWLKPGGYIVMRTLYEFKEEEIPYSDVHYVWTDDDIKELGESNNLTMVKGPFVDKAPKSSRLVWWWQKPGQLKKYSIDPISCTKLER